MARSPAPSDVLDAVDALGPPGTPVTTPEVAEGFECTQRTVSNRLGSLADDGVLQTKEVGANSRVWWRPADGDVKLNGGEFDRRPPVSLRDGQSPSFTADSEMAERIREFEWAETPLGPVEAWPAELKTAVDIMLGAEEAIGLYWGEDSTLLYNDLAREQIGEKHPDALGRPAREVFPEAWEVLGPMHEQVMAGGGAVRVEEQYLPLERGDEVEDAWWNSSFNPIPRADGSVGGVFNVSVEATDRMRAESELRDWNRESEERLDVAVRNSPLTVWQMDTDFRYTWLKHPHEAFEVDEVLGKRDDELLPPDAAETVMEPKRRAVETGETVREEVTYELPSGDVVAYDLTVAPLRNENGAITGVTCAAFDITERKRAEQELHESEARLSGILAQVPVAIGIVDTEGTFTLQNDRMQSLIPPGKVPSRDPDKMADWSRTGDDGKPLPPEQWPAARALRGEDVSGGIEFRYERDDTSRWMNVGAVPFREDGEITGAIVTIEDITERKDAEAALRANEKRLRLATDTASIAVFEWDLETDLVSGNERLNEMFGYDEDETIVGSALLEERVHPADREWVGDRLEEAFEPGSSEAYEFEFRAIHPDGSERWVLTNGEVFFENDGDDRRAVRVRGTGIDITERKEMEETLRESEAQVSNILAQLPIGVGVLNADGRYEVRNDRLEEILDGDLLPSRDPEKQDEWSATDADGDPLPPEQWPGARALRGEAVSPGVEFRLDRDGETRWFNVAVVPFEESGGQPRAIGVIQEITERKEAEEEIRKSEEKYRTLFESIDKAFMTMEVLFDEDDEAVDFRYLETNSAFEEITGYVDVEGERMRDLEPDYERQRIEKYGRIALTGEPERFTDQAGYLEDRWFDVFAFRIGEPQDRTVAVLFTDITERKRRESATALLVEISNDLSRLSTPDEIIDTVGTRLGEFLQVSTCLFADVDEANDEATVHHGWNSADVPSLEQTFQLEEYFGDEFARAGRAGETLVVRDTARDERANTEAYARLDIGAFVTVPFQWQGRWVANITVTSREPRDWRHDEIELLEDIAARVFPRIERTRAQQALTQFNQSLERLNAATQELIDAEAATIPNRIARLVRNVLDVEYAALWQYDDQRGDLEEHAVDVAPDVDGDAVELPSGSADRIWETFVGTDVDVANDLDVPADAASPLRSRAFVPLGRHGVVCLGSTGADTFDERTRDLVETVASTVESAWNRAESEAELAVQNEELQRLDRLNRLIRQINEALVGAETVDGVYEDVCRQLADSSLFEFAWVGTHDSVTDAIEPRAWAGVDSEYIEDVSTTDSDSTDRPSPVATALRGGTLQVVSDVVTDPAFASWREATLERGARSLVSIPLVDGDARYGVLTVYADRPNPEDRDLDVLEELGSTIAHSISARETVLTRQTDLVVELTLRFTDAGTPLSRLSRHADCRLVLEGFVPRANGETDVFFTVERAATEAVRAASYQVLSVVDLDCLSERPSTSLFRARVTEEELVARLVAGGAVVRDLTYEAGDVSAVVDLEESAEVRRVVDDLRDQYSAVELFARQPRERPLKTRRSFVDVVRDRLTARQLEILETAYLSGYFDTPRTTTGQEIIEFLDISQPTFSQHLRAAERSIFGLLFRASQNQSSPAQ